jgi:hypothetical protein
MLTDVRPVTQRVGHKNDPHLLEYALYAKARRDGHDTGLATVPAACTTTATHRFNAGLQQHAKEQPHCLDVRQKQLRPLSLHKGRVLCPARAHAQRQRSRRRAADDIA